MTYLDSRKQRPVFQSWNIMIARVDRMPRTQARNWTTSTTQIWLYHRTSIVIYFVNVPLICGLSRKPVHLFCCNIALYSNTACHEVNFRNQYSGSRLIRPLFVQPCINAHKWALAESSIVFPCLGLWADLHEVVMQNNLDLVPILHCIERNLCTDWISGCYSMSLSQEFP